ncbi:HEPN domain-containing protein [Acutalibacter muris]|uniref:HEPN domain-containing protein n=1 Tax=Acutalibacter muris TaxID=1796620 RepID=UPI001C3E8CA4|nr:HEPN domain-containing protein [Acutalibacter muris]
MSDFSKAAYWLDCADYDLQTAKAMLETKRFLYVGFMCHQTIEKGLKAIFVQRRPDSELPYIHSLVRLANLSKISAEMSEEQLSLLDILSPLNVEARYPLNKEKLLRSLTESRCENLIRKTEDLLIWIKTKC